MFRQTEARYKTILMGYGDESIYEVGCYLVSLVNGLNSHGWNFTPESMNELLKEKGLWFGPYGNYINVNKLALLMPTVFRKYSRLHPWNDSPFMDALFNDDTVILGNVSDITIGGNNPNGGHFVLVTSVEGKNMPIINDPWTGLTGKVTNWYIDYDNLIGLRIFTINEAPEWNDPKDELAECQDKLGYYERTVADLERDLEACQRNLANCENDKK